MEKLSQTINIPKTEQERIDYWHRKMQFYKDSIRELEGHIPEDGIELLKNEVYGGVCKCGRYWKRVEVNNLFAKGSYFLPDCSCYDKCYRCGKHQYIEQESGRYRGFCVYCDFPNTREAFDKFIDAKEKRNDDIRDREKKHEAEQRTKDYIKYWNSITGGKI